MTLKKISFLSKRFFRGFVALLFLLALAEVALAAGPVFFGVPPYKSPVTLSEEFAPLIKYLEQETGEKIQFRSAKNGGETVKALVGGGIDVAYLMPALYVRADQKSKGKVQILRSVLNNGKPFFKGMIVAKDDSAINSLQDLQGNKFAFGFRESTLTFYIPAHALIKAGVMDSMEYKHVGKPENVATSIQKGFFDAGGIRPDMKAQYVGKGMKVVYESEPIRNAVFVTGPNMDPGLRKKFEDAFNKLDDQAILKAFGPNITGLAPSTSADYDNLRKIIKEVDAKFPRQGQ